MNVSECEIDEFKDRLLATSGVMSLEPAKYEGYYSSSNRGLCIHIDKVKPLDDSDTVCIDLCTGKFYGGVHSIDELPTCIQRVIKWYQDVIIGKGDTNMSKKEINEAIGNDIQKLASDLTKKREMDKANSSAEDIAKKLGVKLPKSKK